MLDHFMLGEWTFIGALLGMALTLASFGFRATGVTSLESRWSVAPW